MRYIKVNHVYVIYFYIYHNIHNFIYFNNEIRFQSNKRNRLLEETITNEGHRIE